MYEKTNGCINNNYPLNRPIQSGCGSAVFNIFAFDNSRNATFGAGW